MTKILLVEDDKSLREIYGVRLLAEGYDIVSAGDGEEALAMAIKDRPNLIVSDVMMPKISGFDMLDILRSTTETKDIKVIMMTALSSEEQRLRGVALGADRYLVKSQVGIEDVVRTVHEVLGDAPISGQTPLMTASPAAAPVAPAPFVAPTAPVAPFTPMTAGPGAVDDDNSHSMPTAAPAPIAPPVAPMPAPVAPAPAAPVVSEPAPVTPALETPPRLPNSVLPEPTAPFSTPRNGTLASRVIQPIEADVSAPDFTNLMSQELSTESATSTQPENTAVSTNIPVSSPEPSVPTPAPMASPFASSTPAAPSGLGFEQNSRPTPPTFQSPPPIPPAPNTGL